MTQHDDFDPLIAPARGRAGREAVRTYETIKRHAPTAMDGVLSGFCGSIEKQVRLAALAGHASRANKDAPVPNHSPHHPPPHLAPRPRQTINTHFARCLPPTPPNINT